MEYTDKVAHAQDLIGNLSMQELEFLRGLVAGEAQGALASRLTFNEAEAAALKQSLMKKLQAKVIADVVRVGIYAGL